jgi:hypothetical protein
VSTLLDKTANVAVIVASIALCVAAVAYLRREPAAAPQPSAQQAPATYRAGDTIDAVPAAVVGQTPRSLLLVVRSTCKFCTENMPFYQRLAARRASESNIRLVAVSTEPVATTRDYLKQHAVAFDDVLQVPPASLKIRGTPTLILIDKERKVLESWVGLVADDREPVVMQSVFAVAAR